MTDKLTEEKLWGTSKLIDAKEGKLDPADIEWIQHLMLEAADELHQCRAENEALRSEKRELESVIIDRCSRIAKLKEGISLSVFTLSYILDKGINSPQKKLLFARIEELRKLNGEPND